MQVQNAEAIAVVRPEPAGNYRKGEHFLKVLQETGRKIEGPSGGRLDLETPSGPFASGSKNRAPAARCMAMNKKSAPQHFTDQQYLEGQTARTQLY
jgi:hypothetical protein